VTTDLTGQAPAEINNAPTTTPTPPVEAKTPSAEDKKMLELARITKLQRQQQLKIQADREAFARQQQEFTQKQKDYETNYIPKERIQKDLVGVLSEAGLNMEQINQLVQNKPVELELEVRTLKQQLSELRSFIDEGKKKAEENQSTQYQQALNQIELEAKNLSSKDDRFETIKELKQEKAVVHLVEHIFKNGLGEQYPKGTILNTEDACTLVEEQLVENAAKMAGLNKVKKKLEQAVPPAEAVAQTPSAGTAIKNGHTVVRQNIAPKTLSNSMQAVPSKSLSYAQKRARAIAIAEGREPQ
jgi:hypothetical protein